MSVLQDCYQIVAGSGQSVASVTAETTQAGFAVGKVYIITVNTDSYFRWSGSAVAASDGNFDIFLPAGSSAILRCTNATARVIRDSADGICGISEIAIV